MQYFVLSELIGRFISFILLIVAIRLDLGLIFIFIGVAIGNILQFTLVYFRAKQIIPIGLKTNLFIWKKILFKSLPIGISWFLVFIYYRIDTIILSLYKPSYDVGIYGASYKILD